MGYIAEHYGVKSQALTYYEKSISQSPIIYMPYLKLGVMQYREIPGKQSGSSSWPVHSDYKYIKNMMSGW